MEMNCVVRIPLLLENNYLNEPNEVCVVERDDPIFMGVFYIEIFILPFQVIQKSHKQGFILLIKLVVVGETKNNKKERKSGGIILDSPVI